MKLFHDFVALLYPRLCAGCNEPLIAGEDCICVSCLLDLPLTRFEEEPDNPVSRIFWGRANIEQATAFCLFDKGGKVQHMLHRLKYKGDKAVGRKLGAMLGSRLNELAHYASIDAIVPVPLHPRKEKIRGYNQSAEFGKGIADEINKPLIIRNLIRTNHTASQTRKGRFERWENVSDIFQVSDPLAFEGKHLLLVDDVITTGATLESCCQALLEVANVRVSIATIATA